MTRIQPFKAVIYNEDKIKDLSKVVCPPYDIISPERQQYYHDISPNNLIHVILGKDVPGENKYERAASTFDEWQKNKVLERDSQPAIYFYSQTYKVKGEAKVRLGFIALLRLADQKSAVYAHEHTRIEPKEDRLRLIRQVKANLSPIFVVFPDENRIIQRTDQKYLQNKKPFIDITDDEKIRHELWRVDDPAIVKDICDKMRDEDIFIADGHHRYEVACMFRDEIAQKQKITGDESFNYIMAYFTCARSRGLTIFPIHRLVKIAGEFNIADFKLNLAQYFDIEELKDRSRFLFLMEKAGSIEHVIGMYKDKRYWLLRLKNVRILDKMIPDKPQEYRTLDVSALNYIILNKILGLELNDKSDVEFIPDTEELLRRVDEDRSRIAFLLNPVRMQQIMSVALKGEKMPPKSTYFYPKVLSGLVMNKLE